MLPAKKLKPLTLRQADVLAKLAFGEISLVEIRPVRGSPHVKWNDCGVDATSVVRKLPERKLIRLRTITINFGRDYQRETTRYATPTPAGFAELEKHPFLWND